MNQPVQIHQDSRQSPSLLWWKPLMAMQADLNQMMKQSVADTPLAAFFTPSLWELEEDLFANMQRQSNRILSELFNSQQLMVPLMVGSRPDPLINIIENERSFLISAEFPGVNVGDLDISTSDGVITLSGKRLGKENNAGTNYLHQEFRSDSYFRSIALPEEADLKKINARFDQNILTMEIPKKQTLNKNSPTLKITLNEQTASTITGGFAPLSVPSSKPHELQPSS